MPALYRRYTNWCQVDCELRCDDSLNGRRANAEYRADVARADRHPLYRKRCLGPPFR